MRFLLLVVALLSLRPEYVHAQQRAAGSYDIVITGGRVIDPASGTDSIRNVGVRSGRIAAVTRSPIRGRKVIDARGLVVAPGFIDLVAAAVKDEGGSFKATDGVTTNINMHGGPVKVAEWIEKVRAAGSIVNYGTVVGHPELRYTAGVRDSKTAATPAQVDSMVALARAAIDEGAVGIGFGLEYTPGASRDEVVRLFELAAEKNVPVHLHIRYLGGYPPNNNALAAIEEVIAAAAASGASAQVIHIGSSAGAVIDAALYLINGARKRGIDIMADVYPYTAGSTALGTTVFDEGWQQRMGGISYGDIELVTNGERLTEESFARLRKEAPGTMIVVHFIPDSAVRKALQNPYVMIASDDHIENGRGHPRGAGTFSRVLGRFVREERVLSLQDAIAKMTIMPARRLEKAVPAMRRKGRLGVGADADIVVFDSARVIDRATYAKPAQHSVGFMHVLVNGVPVVSGGVLQTGVRPGQAVRH